MRRTSTRLTFQFVPDPNTRAVNILGGSSNIAMIPCFDTLDRLADDDNIETVRVDVPAVVMMPIHVNVNSTAFSDVRVRQALGFAIDRTRFANVVFGGQGRLSCRVV